MSAVSKVAWHVECDVIGCTGSTLDADEPYIYDTAEEAISEALGWDWVKLDDGRMVCPNHWSLLTETETGWALSEVSA